MTNLEDRLAIHDLFVRYATALDGGEVETVVGCFTVDAALESPAIGRIQGSDAIRAFAARFAAWRGDGMQYRHLITNLAVEIDAGGERGSATAYLLVLISQNNAHRTLPPGRYECQLVKQDGVWRFTRRVVFHDHDYTLDDR
jgi:ketosteroid isomerase-like protein